MISPAPATTRAPAPAKRRAFSELELEELAAWLAEQGEPAYRARQIFHGYYQELVRDFNHLTNLPHPLRTRLAESFRLRQLTLLRASESPEDAARKLLLGLPDGASIESVLIPQPWSRAPRESRLPSSHHASPISYLSFSGCLSSQAGCALACTFCATGAAGFERNLTRGEIVEQALELVAEARRRGGRLANLVFMGMGEPLANYTEVLAAVRRINHPDALGLGARHITISTAGLAPQIEQLAEEGLKVGLALSLVAPSDDLRSRLMPINRAHPLVEVLAACRHYARRTGRRVTYEYVLLAGMNDTPACAHQVAALLRGQLAHLNLIPFNPTPALPYRRSSPEATRAFRHVVEREAQIPVTVRHSLGGAVEGACGQLKAAYEATRSGPSRRARRAQDDSRSPRDSEYGPSPVNAELTAVRR